MKKLFVLLLFVCLPLWVTVCQEASQEIIEFSAQKMSGSMKRNQDYTKLSGGATIKTSSLEIQADSIELYGKDFRFIKAEGSVRGM